jgi:hypothetical protein
MKYIKRPIVVEAFEYQYQKELPDWAMEKVNSNEIVLWEGFLTIETLEGTMRADPGDYVIKGIAEEIYPCKAEIFEQLYDLFIPLNGEENGRSNCSDSL